MQRPFLFFLASITALILSTFHPSIAQTSGHRLNTADSLFDAQRYTQSLEHYEEILRQRQYTPSMLLKMAYVNEGLDHIGAAMYYLNLYWVATHDKSVINKMDELAEKFDLEGYETTDSDRFWAFYQDQHLNISLLLAASIILALAVVYRTRIRLHQRPLGSAITVAALAILLFMHQQYGDVRLKGIIAQPSTYLMAGPSAGAPVIDVVGDGHRVQVIGKKDVWLKVRWDDDVAYVKQNSLRPIRL